MANVKFNRVPEQRSKNKVPQLELKSSFCLCRRGSGQHLGKAQRQNDHQGGVNFINI